MIWLLPFWKTQDYTARRRCHWNFEIVEYVATPCVLGNLVRFLDFQRRWYDRKLLGSSCTAGNAKRRMVTVYMALLTVRWVTKRWCTSKCVVWCLRRDYAHAKEPCRLLCYQTSGRLATPFQEETFYQAHRLEQLLGRVLYNFSHNNVLILFAEPAIEACVTGASVGFARARKEHTIVSRIFGLRHNETFVVCLRLLFAVLCEGKLAVLRMSHLTAVRKLQCGNC